MLAFWYITMGKSNEYVIISNQKAFLSNGRPNQAGKLVADGQSTSELIWMIWSRCGPVPITEIRQPDSSSRRLT